MSRSATRPATLVAAAAAVSAGVLLWLLAAGVGSLVDLRVYAAAGHAIAIGSTPYGTGFVYPPAALPLAVLASLGDDPRIIGAIWSALSLLAWARSAQLLARVAWPHRPAAGLWVFAAGCLTQPVILTMAFGQLGLLLLWLVLEGGLRATTHPRRAVLIGVAVAVKVTPAIVLVPLLLVRRWRPVAWAAAGALAATAVGALVAPAAAVEYLTGAWRLANDINQGMNAQDHSIAGLVQTAGAPALLGWVLAAGTAAAGMVAAVRAWRVDDALAALAVSLVTGLLVSPLSWGHHWVAALPALVLLARARTRASLALLAVAAVGMVGWVDVLGRLDRITDAGWSWGELLQVQWTVVWGLAFLGWALAQRVSTTPPPVSAAAVTVAPCPPSHSPTTRSGSSTSPL